MISTVTFVSYASTTDQSIVNSVTNAFATSIITASGSTTASARATSPTSIYSCSPSPSTCFPSPLSQSSVSAAPLLTSPRRLQARVLRRRVRGVRRPRGAPLVQVPPRGRHPDEPRLRLLPLLSVVSRPSRLIWSVAGSSAGCKRAISARAKPRASASPRPTTRSYTRSTRRPCQWSSPWSNS